MIIKIMLKCYLCVLCVEFQTHIQKMENLLNKNKCFIFLQDEDRPGLNSNVNTLISLYMQYFAFFTSVKMMIFR